MKCAGIIVEWNPFHRGHCLPLLAARQHGATHIVAVMSGNYVQRGEAALLPKEYRVRAALQNGCDLVLELPLPYATATAERFAAGGVALLSALGMVDSLVFGSEAGDTAPLAAVADLLDTPVFSATLAEELSCGLPFAAARERATASLLGAEAAAVLSSPNNILGIEYLAALRRQGSRMVPLTVARQGAAHDGKDAAGGFASASLLRQRLRSGEPVAEFLPAAMAEELAKARAEGRMAEPSLWERPLMAQLRRMSEEDFAALPDLSEGLEHRLYRESRTAPDSEALLDAVKSKRYSHARLRRILLAAWLGIPADLMHTPPPYLRILGMNPRGAEILAAAKGRASLPLSPSLAELSRTGETATRMAALEARATDLYNIITPIPHPCDEEYTRPLQKVGAF